MTAGPRAPVLAPLLTRLTALLLLLVAVPALAAEPSPAMKARADQLIGLFNAKGPRAELFAPSFLAQVPIAQVDRIAAQLTGQYGPARSVTRIDSSGDSSATIFVDFERAVVRAELVIEPAPPGRITGLLVSSAEVKSDTLAAVMREYWVLPGQSSLAIARLDPDKPPSFSIAYKSEQPLAVASAFKLFLLAELSRSIQAGERKWSDVVPLDRRSIPSGFLQTWPAGSPVTLHTLAALMISQSDNSAADTLLHLFGREKVEQLLPTLGIAAPGLLRPLLGTREAALLKAGGKPELAAQWASASEAERRKLLAGPLADQPPEIVDFSKLAAAPNAIQSIEWFASTNDLARVMDWLRVHGDRETLEILAINAGVGRPVAAQFAYLGYKGGSESGVMNMTFLLHNRAGQWFAISGTWNNPAAPVDETRFAQLMSRALALLK